MLWQSLLICLPFIICEFQMTMLMNKRFVSFSSGMPFLLPLKPWFTGTSYWDALEQCPTLRAPVGSLCGSDTSDSSAGSLCVVGFFCPVCTARYAVGKFLFKLDSRIQGKQAWGSIMTLGEAGGLRPYSHR